MPNVHTAPQTTSHAKLDAPAVRPLNLALLERIVVGALEDVKAKDIEIIDTAKVSALFDRIVVASADSNRQTRALARNVRDKVNQAGGDILSIEGEETGEWVLVDLGDIVVHIMQPAIRSHYRLEELWATTPASRTKVTAVE